MANLSIPYTFSNSTIASATEVNSNFAQVKSFVDASLVQADGSVQASAAAIASNAVTTVKILDANVTTAKLADASVTSAKLAPPTLTLKASSFTLALADANCTLSCTAASGTTTVTVPTVGAVAFPIGTVITFINSGSSNTVFGGVTFAPAGGSIILVGSSNGLRLRTQYSAATLIKITDTYWVLTGDTIV